MTSFPVAAKRITQITQHDFTRIDEYFWMRERENPEVLKHLQAENAYLEAALQHTAPLQDLLFQELKGRIKEVDSSVPEKRGDYFYYTRTEADKQYPLYCRKKDALDAEEQLLLDQNHLAEGSEYCSVGTFAISPDGNILAYSLDLQGTEDYTLYLKDLTNDTLYAESIPSIFGSFYYRGGVEWANDSRTLYYVSLDEMHRACKLFRHRVGTDPADDLLIFHETDDSYSLSLFKTRSERFLMTFHQSTLAQEIRFMAADETPAELTLLRAREEGLEYFATHHGDSFFIITNENAPNYKLMKAPLSAFGRENWQEVLGHRSDTMIEHIDVFEKHIVLHERRNGLKQLRISHPDGGSDIRYVTFPDPTYEVWVEQNAEFKSDLLRLRYSSFISPASVVNVDMDTGEWETLKVDEIPSGYDKAQYVVEYIQAAADGGMKVPISLIHKKGLIKNGMNPTLLYGYGAYGASTDAAFNSTIFSLIDRGFVFAIAHVRGGSELGRSWYDDGRLLNKDNSIKDFIACAEYLIGEGYTIPQKLAITGSSAGGLLVGASMIMRPELFNAVICKVPFLDVVTSMSDPTIPLTTLEYDEWGNPDQKDAFEYMLSYSPYDNIRPVQYPNLLLTTGFNDPRVAYWEPAKFAARLRDMKTGDGLVLLQTSFSAGHAGASGRYDFLRESVLDYAFLIDRLASG